MVSNNSSNTEEDTNKHAPPSSCEEAAALLGAAISFDTSSSNVVLKHQEGQSNPPQGMHSIFTVQEPIPNQVLFIRLCNLRAWLRWHASGLDDPPDVGLDNDDCVSEIYNYMYWYAMLFNTHLSYIYLCIIFIIYRQIIINWVYPFHRKRKLMKTKKN